MNKILLYTAVSCIWLIAVSPIAFSYISSFNAYAPIVGILLIACLAINFHWSKLNSNEYIGFDMNTSVLFSLYFILLFYLTFNSLFSFSVIESFQRVLLVFSPVLLLLLLASNYIAIYFNELMKFYLSWCLFAAFYSLTIFLFGELNFSNDVLTQTFTILGIEISQFVTFRSSEIESIRLSSFTSNPNYFARLLIFSIPFNLALCFLRKWRAFYLISFFCVILSIYLSGSRTAFYVMFLSVSLFFVFYLLFKYNRIYLVRFFSLSSVFVLFLVGIILAVDPPYMTTDVDLSGRQEAWFVLSRSIESNALIGLGFGLSSDYLINQMGVGIGAHNLYLALLFEVGLIGYMIVFLVMAYPIVFFKVHENVDKKSNLYVVACLSSLLSLYVHQIFEVGLFSFGVTNIFFVLSSIFLVVGSRGKPFTFSKS